MASVVLKNVYKKYPGGVVAVSDFNIEIEDKDFVILVGPSGCGKTTTLRMIAGLEEITEGEVYIGNKLVNDVAPKDRDIAMVFQNYALYPHMTVYENMAFGLKLRKMPKDEIKKRVDEAAKVLDIAHLLDRKPKALSGGQRQRVALGRAIVREPRVFLLDEPLANLDAKLRTQMRTEITKLHLKLGTTFIYVTHDQIEAMTMGTKVVVMKDGFIQQTDTPQNLYDYPVNLFVAGFMGTPQMNFLPSTLEERNGKVGVAFGKSFIVLPAARVTDEIRSFIGKEIVAGCRPDHVHDEEEMLAEYPESTVDAYIEVTEKMGSETYLYMLVEGFNVIAKVDPKTKAAPGMTHKITFNPNKLYLFDKETEKAIAF